MVVIYGFYEGHLLPIYLLRAIYSISRDRHSTPVPIIAYYLSRVLRVVPTWETMPKQRINSLLLPSLQVLVFAVFLACFGAHVWTQVFIQDH